MNLRACGPVADCFEACHHWLNDILTYRNYAYITQNYLKQAKLVEAGPSRGVTP
jgi:hypothetical protein